MKVNPFIHVPLEFAKLSHEDVKMYFDGTVVLARHKDGGLWKDARPFYIQNGDGVYVNGQFAGEDDKIFKQGQLDVRVVWPEGGLYNYKATTILFGRRTTRQYKKGICPATFFVDNLIGRVAAAGLLPQQIVQANLFQFSLQTVAPLFNPEYPKLGEAYKVVESGKAFFRAISRDLALSMGIDTTSPTLWFRSNPVGTVESPKKIVVTDSIFAQEVSDGLRDSGNINGVSLSAA
jgi:hypothetical protein